MQTETGRKTLIATTAAANLTLSATTAMWPERAAQAQASAPAGVTTNGGTIRMIK